MSEHTQDPNPWKLGCDQLRIGFFTDVYLPQVNGVAISVSLLAHQLREMGHEVFIFAPDFVGHPERDKNVFRLPAVRYMDMPPIDIALPGSPRLALTLRHMNLDIIHSHTPLTLGLLACLTARLKRRPLVCTYHTSITDYTHYLKVAGERPLIKRAAVHFSALTCNVCDRVAVPSAKFEKLLRDQHVRPPVQVIPNGIDLARFRCPGARGAFRQKLGLTVDAFVLVALGRLEVEKSLDFVIEAFAQVAHAVPQARLVLVGDGSARAALQELAEKSGVSERILFTGMVDRSDIPALLHEADLYLSSSTTEVHPLAMIEAIASGLPVVGVRDEALRGMVIDGVNGWITPKELGAFGRAILRLISEPAMLRAFGQASERLSEKYSIQAQAATLIELYRRLITESASTRSVGKLALPPRWQRHGPTT